MSKFARLATNPDAEVSGVWREWTNGDDASTIEFLLARAGSSNKPFRVLSESVTRKYRKAGVEMERLPPETQDAMSREIYSKTIVLDWRGPGVTDENGQLIPCNEANIVELFTTVPDTLQFCTREAMNAQNYREAELKAEAGN